MKTIMFLFSSCSNIGPNGSLWHDHIGHPYLPVMQHIVHNMNKVLKPNTIPNMYNACQLGKSYRLHVINVCVRSHNPFDIIHVIYGDPH